MLLGFSPPIDRHVDRAGRDDPKQDLTRRSNCDLLTPTEGRRFERSAVDGVLHGGLPRMLDLDRAASAGLDLESGQAVEPERLIARGQLLDRDYGVCDA